jgi:hypothetical protein
MSCSSEQVNNRIEAAIISMEHNLFLTGRRNIRPGHFVYTSAAEYQAVLGEI